MLAEAPGKWLLQQAQAATGDFFEAYQQASEAGADNRDLVAARTLYCLKSGDVEGLIAVTPELEEIKDELSYGPNDTFASQHQLMGLVHAVAAIKAYRNQDWAELEQSASKSFAAWPEWAGAFGLDQMLLQHRINEVKKAELDKLVIPMTTEVRDLEGNPVSLASIAEGKKAILIDLWAAWCGPCIMLMPELQKKHDQLSPQGIYVVGLNTDSDDPLAKAASVKEAHGMNMPWLVENEMQSISRLLLVDSIPRMALIAPDGRLLWTGHPVGGGLEEALAKLDVELSTDE